MSDAIGRIMRRLDEAETNGEPSEFCDGLRIAADIVADAEMPQHVEVYVWKKNEEKGYLDKVRTKTIAEVYDELREILGEYPDGGEEYFSVSVSQGRDREWPDGDIVCFSVNGSSEGDFCHVEVHYNGSRDLVFLGKTFMGRDASWAFARRLADLLEIQ